METHDAVPFTDDDLIKLRSSLTVALLASEYLQGKLTAVPHGEAMLGYVRMALGEMRGELAAIERRQLAREQLATPPTPLRPGRHAEESCSS